VTAGQGAGSSLWLAESMRVCWACAQCRLLLGMQVVPALAIHDTMKHIGSDVATVGFGACLGMTGFLMAVGKKVGRQTDHDI